MNEPWVCGKCGGVNGHRSDCAGDRSDDMPYPAGHQLDGVARPMSMDEALDRSDLALRLCETARQATEKQLQEAMAERDAANARIGEMVGADPRQLWNVATSELRDRLRTAQAALRHEQKSSGKTIGELLDLNVEMRKERDAARAALKALEPYLREDLPLCITPSYREAIEAALALIDAKGQA